MVVPKPEPGLVPGRGRGSREPAPLRLSFCRVGGVGWRGRCLSLSCVSRLCAVVLLGCACGIFAVNVYKGARGSRGYSFLPTTSWPHRWPYMVGNFKESCSSRQGASTDVAGFLRFVRVRRRRLAAPARRPGKRYLRPLGCQNEMKVGPLHTPCSMVPNAIYITFVPPDHSQTSVRLP